MARMAGGAAALLTALVLRHAVPAEPVPQLIGWGVLLAVGLAFNFAALFGWLLRNGRGVRPAELWPVVEMFPALSVGAALSWALILNGQFDLLAGAWMALYGVSHAAYRRTLPFPVYCGGLVYVAAGIVCLLRPPAPFTDPRPMGVVFGLGELFGGWMLVGSGHDHQ
jgi:ribose/xylose/arabinose/galactoside ABC-type transport system permease subunit